MKRIKYCFTLLEITLALTILVLIASVTGVQIKQLVDVHRFEKGVGELFIALQEAQVLSAAYQTDFSLDIDEEKQGIFYRFSTEEPFLEKKCSQEKIPLPQTALFRFKDKPSSHLHLNIYSGGRIDPPGVLAFLHSKEEGSRRLYLDLQYGHLIKFCYSKPFPFDPSTNLQNPTKT